jgi:PadR family transcriptional regulator
VDGVDGRWAGTVTARNVDDLVDGRHPIRQLRVFVEDPATPCYGLELMKATGLPSGSLYPALARLERAGWVRSRRENIDPVIEGRPPRRYYELTPDGLAQARCELAVLAEQLRPPGHPKPGFPQPHAGRA